MHAKTLIGIFFMLGAMGVLPMIDVIAKYLGQNGIPVLQIVWARLALGALVTLPAAARRGGLVPERPWLHTARACLLMAATFLFFSALKFLPIADALAIFFVQPLVLTALSPFVLGERVSLRRWIAVGVGFVGTLIIIRPGMGAFNPGSLLALGSGTALALYLLMTRKISGQAPAIVTTFQTNAIGGLIASALVGFVWVAPTASQWGLFLALAVIANLGHWMIVKAYDHAEASLLAPLAYTEMVTSTIFGLLFFGDFPDGWTFAGVGILIACAIYISTVKERAAATP
ncbi:DMT family transporter [Stagnihabitans tardus]|uniref:EamA family transporter n=1 Tax=Stagnihabitans tardus TaxID=2699202 RepID=A0AAE5BVL2_9RHOB|nr:DMT family transporter [Stagnihabitans tardus]NBZ89076.1 EamA family transporter [Stagnihabitans tardus]